MNTDPFFSPQNGEPQWKEAVKIWNVNADRSDNISYKVCTPKPSYLPVLVN
jgi:hypothetical protein